MPLLTEAAPRKKRRAPVWVLILAGTVFPVVGVFAWSWFQPVAIPFGWLGDGNNDVRIAFGYQAVQTPHATFWYATPRYGHIVAEHPGGIYYVNWDFNP